MFETVLECLRHFAVILGVRVLERSRMFENVLEGSRHLRVSLGVGVLEMSKMFENVQVEGSKMF